MTKAPPPIRAITHSTAGRATRQIVHAPDRGDACYEGKKGWWWHTFDDDGAIIVKSLMGPFDTADQAQRNMDMLDAPRSPDLTEATSPNTFLRRVDVEALLNAKITASAGRINDWGTQLVTMLGADKPDLNKTLALHQRMVDEEDRAGALRVALKHLNFLDPFTLTDGGVECDYLTDRNGIPAEVKK